MKKLMIAAAIVCAAAFAQAATATWTASGIPAYGTDTTSKGYIAYLFAGDSTAASAMSSALAGGDFSGLGDAASSVAVIKLGTNPESVNKTKIGDYTVGDWYDHYMVVFNTTDADIKNNATAFIITDSIHVQTPSAGALPLMFGNVPTTWNTIPEPTSGLLLLLGVAGLALKRRRA